MGIPSLLLVGSVGFGWSDLRLLLRSMHELRVVGETTDVDQAIELASTLAPDLVLLGSGLNRASTVPLATQIHAGCPNARIILCTQGVANEDLLPLNRAGMVVCLLRNDLEVDVIYHCLAALSAADLMIGSRAVGEAFFAAHCPSLKPVGDIPTLSSEEDEAVRLLAGGLTPKEIAAQKHVAPQTVSEHLRRARNKLFVQTNPQLVGRALASGIIELPRS